MVTAISPPGGTLSEEKERTALCSEASKPPIAIGPATDRADAISIIAVKIALPKDDYPLPLLPGVPVAGDSKYRAMTSNAASRVMIPSK